MQRVEDVRPPEPESSGDASEEQTTAEVPEGRLFSLGFTVSHDKVNTVWVPYE